MFNCHREGCCQSIVSHAVFLISVVRLHANQSPVVFSSEQVKKSVGSLADIANAVLQFAKHSFAMKLFPLVVEVDAFQMAGARNFSGAHAADEDIVLPVGKLIAGVKGHAGNRDCGNPEDQRRFHSFLPGDLTDARAKVEPSETHHWPSVILAGLENIDLIATIGAVFAFPNVPCDWIHRKSESVPMTHGED